MGKSLNIKTKLMGKGLTVSTVQLYGSEAKRGWFETLVFHRATGYVEWDGRRYKTEAEARAGHRRMVDKWKAKSRKEIRDELAEKKQKEDS